MTAWPATRAGRASLRPQISPQLRVIFTTVKGAAESGRETLGER
jgi:hypothetical protein